MVALALKGPLEMPLENSKTTLRNLVDALVCEYKQQYNPTHNVKNQTCEHSECKQTINRNLNILRESSSVSVAVLAQVLISHDRGVLTAARSDFVAQSASRLFATFLAV